ncbi:MAG TPA: cupin domain-containing protein [Acidimicrobiales bacterium]|nr:cupin domain-containing protein [Acidimicrobiales bacterium]
MTTRLQKGAVADPSRQAVEEAMRSEGLSPAGWSNQPGDTYGWHTHPYDKVVCCARGSIVFHTDGGGDLALEAGDRMELPAGTPHAATVGPDGVECLEAHLGR